MAILRPAFIISEIRISVRIFFATTFTLFLAFYAHGQTASPEYKLKAVFLYNFVQFVDWPETAFADPQSPFIIGVLGSDPFGGTLEETVAGEIVKNRKIEVRRYKKVKDIESCHVLFLSASEASQFNSILAGLKGRSILTVSDTEKFARNGGMVRFVTENNKIRFRINLEVTRTEKLLISAKLLQLAEIVSTETRP